MTDRWRLLTGVALPTLAGGIFLAKLAAVAPAYAAACAGAVDEANKTTCTGGATSGDLTYVDSSGTYSEGNFTLHLSDHDITAGGIQFGSTVADTDGTLGEGDGFIILENGSDITNESGGGISAFLFGAGKDLTIDLRGTSTVSGGGFGIFAVVDGGNIDLKTGANVDGGSGNGIRAEALGSVFTTGIILMRTNGNVVGGRNGIDAEASGSILIDARGNVTGGDFGIVALHRGELPGSVLIITDANTSVTGGSRDGIRAVGDSVTVTAKGIVSGQEGGIFAAANKVTVTTGTGSQIGGTTADGIHATASFGTAEVTTGANSSVAGGTDGIFADSDRGDVTVTTGASSTVRGVAGDGIEAQSHLANNATVTIGTLSFVNGAVDGILTQSASGAINVSMEAGASVTGRARGIAALSQEGNVLVQTGAGSEVTGTNGDGIIATSSGGGTVAVIIGDDSAVSSGNDGIFAESLGGGGAVSVGIGAGSDINGDVDGIDARSVSGALSIATGAGARVTGIASAGIRATSASGVITITTAQTSKVEGGGEGISASTQGAGTITITNNGETVGSAAGIDAASGTGAIRIINTGTISNLSRAVDDLAIRTRGGLATIDNSGIILGRIDTSGSLSFVLNNTGIWTASGASAFAGANDTVNNRSVIFVSADAGVAEILRFAGLETLNNAGRIDLMDRAPGANILSDRLETTGNYVGQDGAVLAVDAFLGSSTDSVSDVLAVGGNTSGLTRILVNNTNLEPGVLNIAGILVVDIAGVAHEGDFTLANGPIDTGFFSYDLVFRDGPSGDQFLLVSAADGDVFETLATVSASQAIWHETAGVWEGRQQGLRDRLAQNAIVTAVADPPLAGGAVPESSLWFQALGSWTARDARIGGFDLDYDQSIYGFMAGADVGLGLGDDTTLLLGILAGYVDSTLDFNQSSTAIKHDGATLGAYASLLTGGFFANILVQADLLDMSYSAPSLPFDRSDSADVTSIGGRADIGYRFGGELFVEPTLSLEAVSTTIDEFSVGGADIDPGTNDTIRGGAGLRLGIEGERARASVTGRVWDVFENNNKVDLTPAGPVLALSDDTLEGVYGEVAGQVDVDLSASTVLFARGSLLFSDDISKPSVSGGLNFFW